MERSTLRLILLGWMFCTGLVALAQRIGDSPEAVVAALGQPAMKRSSEDREVWIYPGGKKLTFVQNRLAESEIDSREADAAAAQTKREKARERSKDRDKDILSFGPIRLPSLAAIIGLLGLMVVSFTGLNRVEAGNRAFGIAGFVTVFVLNTTLIALNWYEATQLAVLYDHPGIARLVAVLGKVELLRFALVCLMMFFMWRGSGWAFGIFCLLGVPSMLLGLIVAYRFHQWFPLMPGMFNAWMIAILMTRPVQGFLDRKSKSVAETIRELDRRNFGASQSKK